MDINKYQLRKESLGRGKFGDVLLARYLEKNSTEGNLSEENLVKEWKYSAIKVLNKNCIFESGLVLQVRKEIEILSMMEHQYVVKMETHFEDDFYNSTISQSVRHLQ